MSNSSPILLKQRNGLSYKNPCNKGAASQYRWYAITVSVDKFWPRTISTKSVKFNNNRVCTWH